MKLVVAIVGPTAVGKSKLAFSLAQTLDCEIVSADSRQVYRHMDIGTAKPSLDERKSVPHHLIDIIDPDEDFSLALYQPLAYRAIEDVRQRGKLPLLVGGSGLYVWSVLEGWQIPQVPPDSDFRRRMEEEAVREGFESLHRQLQRIDPAAAVKIDPHNVRRVIRALEVCKATDTLFSRLQQKAPPPFKFLIFGLTTNRDELYERIDCRVDDMMKRGLVEEMSRLVGMGYGFDLPAMSSVGYKQTGEFLQGKVDLLTATRQIKFETHRFARHQYAWFRLDDARVSWFSIQELVEETVLRLVEREMKLLR